MRRLWLFLGAATAIGLGAAAAAPSQELFAALQRFGDAMGAVEHLYIKKTDPDRLVDGALKGMLTSLDRRSDYLTAEEFKAWRTPKAPEAVMGLEITDWNGYVRVVTPLPGSPAEAAGFAPGDEVDAVDGVAISGADLQDATARMKGPPGSRAIVSIRRDGKPIDVAVTRAFASADTVVVRVLGDYAVVRIRRFGSETPRDAAAAIVKLKADNPRLKGFILDLRNNPGGLFDSAVAVASEFLDGGPVVTEQGADATKVKTFTAKPNGDVIAGLPMAVLVNQGTASGAEVVAGALKDRHRAAVVGVTTFGSGSIQTVVPLHGGQDGALKLTTSVWLTPAGRSFQRVGVEPDLEVAQSREEAERFARDQFQLTEDAFPNALTVDGAAARKARRPILDAPPAGFDPIKGDYQLDRAIDLLRAGGDPRKISPPSTVAVG